MNAVTGACIELQGLADTLLCLRLETVFSATRSALAVHWDSTRGELSGWQPWGAKVNQKWWLLALYVLQSQNSRQQMLASIS